MYESLLVMPGENDALFPLPDRHHRLNITRQDRRRKPSREPYKHESERSAA
jgi:hypothetical protein